MSTLLFRNNASTTLSGSLTNTATSLTVSSSSGFPAITGADYFYVTMYEVSGGTEINMEIVKVTNVSGNTWTVVRAQDSTVGRVRDGVATCYVELRWTAAGAALMLQKDRNLADLPSAATARTNLGLGSMATQAASAVAITGGTISGVSLTSLDSTTTIQDNADATKQFRFEASGITAATTRVLTVPDADGTLATLAAVAAAYQPVDEYLTAVAGLSTTGIISRTSDSTAATRTLTAPAAGFTITNGDGVSGNPTFALANDLAAAEAINTTGFVKRTAADTWSAAEIADADLPAALTGKTYNALTLTSNTTGFSVAGGTTSKTLTVNNSITLAGTDATTITLPDTSGTVALNNQTFFIGTTSVAINRASASLSLTGVSIDGSAGSATHLASGVLGSVPYQSGAGATALLAPNTSGTRQFLRMTGTGTVGAAPAWDTVTKTDVGLANVENTALSTWAGTTNIITLGTVTSGTWSASTIAIARGGTGQTTAAAAFNALSPVTTLGDLIYGSGANSATRLAGNTTTTRRFLRQTGDGTNSAAPAWDTLLDADVPSALTGKTYNALTLTANATGFQIAGGTTSKTFIVSNNITLAGTDGSTLNIGAGGTLGSAAYTASTAYAGTSSANTFTANQVVSVTDNTNAALRITQLGTGLALRVEDETNPDASPFAITADGQVGIGTETFPNAGTALRISGDVRTDIILDNTSTSGSNTGQISLTRSSTASRTISFTGSLGFIETATDGTTFSSSLMAYGNNVTKTHNLLYSTLTAHIFRVSTVDAVQIDSTGVSILGTSRRIRGDFSNATFTNRTLFQSSTTNSETSVGVVPNGTSRVGNSAWFNTSDPTNSGYLTATVSDTQAQLMTGATGTGSAVPLAIGTSGTVRLTFGLSGALDLSTGLREARVAMGANAIDVLAGNWFTKTVSGATTFTVSNVPAAGTAASFILDLTNGGSATITWWSGMKWAAGTAPALTAAGRDVLGFFTHDGGTTWTGLLLGKDVK